MSGKAQPERDMRFYKLTSLVVLVVQSTAAVLLIRYVRTLPGERFTSSTAVAMTEVLKLVASCAFLAYQQSIGSMLYTVQHEVLLKPFDTLKVAVPAFIYTLQNNLIYVAVSNLDAATFQVRYWICSRNY